MASVTGYYTTDAAGSAIEHVTDYSASGLAALAEAELSGAVVVAVYDDGTEAQVAASQVSDPAVVGTGSSSAAVSYSASGQGAGIGTASLGFSGTVTIGSAALEFLDGLLVSIS